MKRREFIFAAIDGALLEAPSRAISAPTASDSVSLWSAATPEGLALVSSAFPRVKQGKNFRRFLPSIYVLRNISGVDLYAISLQWSVYRGNAEVATYRKTFAQRSIVGAGRHAYVAETPILKANETVLVSPAGWISTASANSRVARNRQLNVFSNKRLARVKRKAPNALAVMNGVAPGASVRLSLLGGVSRVGSFGPRGGATAKRLRNLMYADHDEAYSLRKRAWNSAGVFDPAALAKAIARSREIYAQAKYAGIRSSYTRRRARYAEGISRLIRMSGPAVVLQTLSKAQLLVKL